MRPFPRDRRHDVAIVAPYATELYVSEESRAAGGAEMQMYYLAQALADQGLRVAHVVHADRRLPPRGGKVEIFQLSYPRRTLRGLRIASAYWPLLRQIDASVNIQRSIGIDTAIVAALSRATRRGFAFSSSSNFDVRGGLTPSRLHARISTLGMRLANTIVVQTNEQRELVRQELRRDATVIRSFGPVRSRNHDPEAFLWVGRLVDWKSPTEYLDLAQRIPEAKFRMVATPSHQNPELEGIVARRAESLENVELLGPQSRDSVLSLFERAVAVISTSRGNYEGFPNTYLEAWSFGVPALSLKFDPDGVIQTHGLGAVAGDDSDALADLVRARWTERNRGEEAARIQQYLRNHHSPEVVGAQWAELIGGLLG